MYTLPWNLVQSQSEGLGCGAFIVLPLELFSVPAETRVDFIHVSCPPRKQMRRVAGRQELRLRQGFSRTWLANGLLIFKIILQNKHDRCLKFYEPIPDVKDWQNLHSLEKMLGTLYMQILMLYWCVSCSAVSNSVQPHGLHAACQAPMSMGFSRQEYWSGLSFPSPGDLPNLGIKPRSPKLQAHSLPSEPPGKPRGYRVI